MLSGGPGRTAQDPAAFLPGGGETGALIRAFDWSKTSTGPIHAWPQSLRTAAALLLHSPVPMVMLWGEDGVMIYNDAYSVFAGGRHPQLLGSKVREGWPEVAEFNDHVMKVVLAGGTLAYRDQELTLNRSGRPEQVWMNLDYSPVLDEEGRPAGVLAIVIETTERVLAERAREAAEAVSNEAAARLRDVLDNIAEGFILLDRDFRVVDINPEGLRLEQRGREEIVGRSHWEVWPDTERSELGRLYRKAMAERVPISFENRYRWPSGVERLIEINAYPVTDGLAIFYRDVSEQRREAAIALEAAERIDLALNSGAILGTWVWDIPADRIVGDERFAQTFGLGAEFVRSGAPLSRAVMSIHPADQAQVEALIAQALKEGHYRAEYRVRGADGGWRWVEANGRVEFDADGNPLRFPGVIVEIDERRRAESALRESEARLRVAQAAGGIGTFELIPGTGRILVSPEFCRIWGVEEVAETDVGHFLALIHPEDRHRVGTGADVLEEHALDPVEYRIHRADTGALRWLARRGEAVRDPQTGTMRWLGVCYDITERKETEEALREREGQLSALLAQATAGFAQVDLEGTFTLVNDRFCEIAGRSREELMTLKMQEITHPEDLPGNIPKFQRAVAEGVPFAHEKRYIRPDGSVVWVNNSVSVIRRPSGEPYGVLAVTIDVTERRRAEESVRENEARLRALTDNLPAGMVYQVATGKAGEERRFLFVSQSCLKLTGHPAEAIMADPSVAYEMIEPADRPRIAAAEEEAIASGRPFDVQTRFRRADGTRRWARIISAPRRLPDGTMVWDGIKIDITDQKEAEAVLRSVNETLEQRIAERTAERDRAWRNTQDMLVTVDHEGVFRSVNPAWTRILGYEESEAVGRSFRDFIHPDDEAPTLAALNHASAHVLARFENRYRRKDGSYRWISWMAAPEAGFVYASGRDVTVEKEASEELARAQEALRQSQKMEAMGQLTGGVAHDFNNLLTPIIGSLDLLHRKALGGEREQRLVEGALQSAERAKTLVQRLLAFARRQPLQAGAVDVGELIAGMADLVDSTSGPSIRIETRIAERLPFARADANQLEMAVLNLAVNARDAMPDGGTITISAEPGEVSEGAECRLDPGTYVRLSVADTGVGMNAAVLARAVEPFFSTKGVGRGTGLGLSMVHGLAAQLGGALTLDSRPGEGTTASLWLPVSREAPAAEAAPGTETPPTGRTGTVLLVEDEPLVRASTADMLAEMGFDVIEAETADQALRLMDEWAPDLVITDHLMPGLSGTELARRIARDRPGLPVVLVSGYADVEGLPPDLPRLTKPFRHADLDEIVRRLLPTA